MICCGYKQLGDGFLATFDGPARAVRCAAAITGAIQPLGIAVRTGLHTGEIELAEDDIGGIAVHTAARIVAMAAPCETLVSDTVRDLVAGSGLRFADRGRQRFAVCPLVCISIRYWLRTEIQTLTSAEDRFSTGAAGFVSVSKVGLGA